MLKFLKKKSNLTFTDNGALTYKSSLSACLDLFFGAGAMRAATEEEVSTAVKKSYTQDPVRTMKIIFHARDVRGGLGEREFFRKAIRAVSDFAPDAVRRNIKNIAEYGRYDDMLALLDTKCHNDVLDEITRQLETDCKAMKSGQPVSLLAKWLPSVNASSAQTIKNANKIINYMGISHKDYRKKLSALRNYIKIIENYLRTSDYTFDYSKQPSGAMLKYSKAFLRNDNERYIEYLKAVNEGRKKLNASVIYPYEVVRRCLDISYFRSQGKNTGETLVLDTTWKNLSSYGNSDKNAIAVVDTSGSMAIKYNSSIRPLDVALSLGIYFAEHNKGIFADHFITFSRDARLVQITGENIVEKVLSCMKYRYMENTNIESVFNLILKTAVENKLSQEDMPSMLYIISDMQFDICVDNGKNVRLFSYMKKKYEDYGYILPEIIFWNVSCFGSKNVPVTMNEQGAVLLSGFSPALFDVAISGEVTPYAMMDRVIFSDRYQNVK